MGNVAVRRVEEIEMGRLGRLRWEGWGRLRWKGWWFEV